MQKWDQSDFYNAKWRRIYERASAGMMTELQTVSLFRSCSVRENPAACKKKRDTMRFAREEAKTRKKLLSAARNGDQEQLKR